MSLNIISVMQSAQVMDNAIAAIWGESCAYVHKQSTPNVPLMYP